MKSLALLLALGTVALTADEGILCCREGGGGAYYAQTEDGLNLQGTPGQWPRDGYYHFTMSRNGGENIMSLDGEGKLSINCARIAEVKTTDHSGDFFEQVVRIGRAICEGRVVMTPPTTDYISSNGTRTWSPDGGEKCSGPNYTWEPCRKRAEPQR